MGALLSIGAKNFRSLRDVHVPLGNLNVLVGPNEAGKSNFLDLIAFLGDSARLDLPEALRMRGGYERVRFRGGTAAGAVSITVAADITTHSSETAPDEYDLRFWTQRARGRQSVLIRAEEFAFKRTGGRGRRIKVHGNSVELVDSKDAQESGQQTLPLRSDSLGLSTLRKTLPDNQGGEEIRHFAEVFTSFRVFNVDVAGARLPSREGESQLTPNATNLASALLALKEHDQTWKDLLDDARAMIPGLLNVEFEAVGGSQAAVAVKLAERGLKDSTYLADASFGTVRLLALLALLYDPNPPEMTCIEEVDHGLHPYLFDRLVERLRQASQRTQLLVATHSPALVNRLRPDELIITERADDGSSRIPAVDSNTIAAKVRAAGDDLSIGELWFAGALGGVPRQ